MMIIQSPSLAQARSAAPAGATPAGLSTAQLKRVMEGYPEQHYVLSIKKGKKHRRCFEQPDLVEGVPACGRGWKYMTFKTPSNPSYFLIPR